MFKGQGRRGDDDHMLRDHLLMTVEIEKQSFYSPVGTLSRYNCCDMGQNDTIGKIELNPSFVLSSDETNCKNDIQLFHQLFDELRVNRGCH